MIQYKELVQHVLDNGFSKSDRTGTGTISTFGYQMRFNLQQGFPLLTTKKVHLKSIIYELLWFLDGNTNNNWLKERGVSIWDGWANDDGELGPVYGAMWRSWPTKEGGVVDQISELMHTLQANPDSRRMIVSGWNPELLPEEGVAPRDNPAKGKQALPPCHLLFQFWTRELTENERLEWAGQHLGSDYGYTEALVRADAEEVTGVLDAFDVPRRGISCQLFQRSADTGLGVPFNIASYALFTMMLGQVINMVPLEFIHSFGDLHIYNNHVSQLKEQLGRECRPLPTMKIKQRGQTIDGFEFEDFELVGYDPHPPIKMEVSV